jgi:hypothetical protein
MAAGDKLTTAASVERVNAWKRHHVGPRPPFRDYQAYHRTMRLGPFSDWTWRGIVVFICGGLILYAMLSNPRRTDTGGECLELLANS